MSEADLSNSVKNGIMYLEDPVDNEWLPHYFVLTQSKLHYTEETNMTGVQDDDEDDDETMPFVIEVSTPNGTDSRCVYTIIHVVVIYM